MNIQFTALEARVIGSLIEKAITTPDQYPLSLNALTNACNQKSNRDPVLDLDERTVQDTLDGLTRKHLVLERSGFGSRVPKYQHRFCNTGFGSLEFSPQETAIICELLLRGPQTPGERRGRASRMAPISEVGEVEAALSRLAAREDGPFVVRLAREPGRRESRFAHLLSGSVEGAAEGLDQHVAEAPAAARADVPRTDASRPDVKSLQDRVAALEQRVEELERHISHSRVSGNPADGSPPSRG
jgi:uncharacterized protein YceH (UPF0502 family)